LFVSISQVIGCEDRLRNDLYCVDWGVELYYIHPCSGGSGEGRCPGCLAGMCGHGARSRRRREGREKDGRARVRAARRVDRKILTPRPARHGRRGGAVRRCRGPPPRSPPPAPPISSSRRQWRMHTATFHYSGPTGPARTFFAARVSEKPRWVRAVRAGPRGSGRVRSGPCSGI